MSDAQPLPDGSPIVRIMCPNLGCRRVLGVPDHSRGKLVRCRQCGTIIRIPLPKSGPMPMSAAPAPDGGQEAVG